MPRQKRALTETGHYHVVIRGSAKQIIFEDDADFHTFLSYLDMMLERHGLHLLAWCLMSNHVHLLLDDQQHSLSLFVHDLSTAYAVYFNARYDRTGPLFDGRFKSVPIESDVQLLSAFRYIHENPVKAGLSSIDSYQWSSYREYVTGISTHVTLSHVYSLLGNPDAFKALYEDSRFGSYSFRETTRLSDHEAVLLAKSLLHDELPSEIKRLERSRRNRELQNLRDAGITIKQLSRLTGLSESTIAHNTHH